jgi:hypothetical protein
MLFVINVGDTRLVGPPAPLSAVSIGLGRITITMVDYSHDTKRIQVEVTTREMGGSLLLLLVASSEVCVCLPLAVVVVVVLVLSPRASALFLQSSKLDGRCVFQKSGHKSWQRAKQKFLSVFLHFCFKGYYFYFRYQLVPILEPFGG